MTDRVPEPKESEHAAASAATPVVSVILPFLNESRFIDEAIQSVAAQSFTAWELLLVDDGSTDQSATIARRHADASRGKIRYLDHPGRANLGQGPSRNLAIGEARGRYVAFLDADDVWLEEKLKRQVAVLESHPEVGMTYGPYFLWYGWTGRAEDEARDMRVEIGDAAIYDCVLPTPGILLSYIRTGGGLPAPCSVLTRRDVLDEVGGFEPEFPGMYDDEALFFKVMLHFPVFVTSERWDKYRQHDESFCERAIRAGLWDRNPRVLTPDKRRLLLWQRRYLDRCAAPPHVRWRVGDELRDKMAELEIPETAC